MEYQEESIFNMAFAYLKRIDKLLYLCDLSSKNHDVYEWTNILNILFREIVVKLTDDEIKIFEGEQMDIKFIINNLDDCVNFRSVNLLCNNIRYSKVYRKELLYLLNKLEMNLRIKMQKKGMLLPSKDDPRRAITKR